MAKEKETAKQTKRGTIRVETDSELQKDHLTEMIRELILLKEKFKLFAEHYGFDPDELWKVNYTPEQLKEDSEITDKLNRIRAALGKSETAKSKMKLQLPKKKK